MLREYQAANAKRRAKFPGVLWWFWVPGPGEFFRWRVQLEEMTSHPGDERVVRVDEFGPLNLRPRKGRAWHPAGKPRRQRATYNRHHGVMHLLAALDLASGKIYCRIRDRKRTRSTRCSCPPAEHRDRELHPPSSRRPRYVHHVRSDIHLIGGIDDIGLLVHSNLGVGGPED